MKCPVKSMGVQGVQGMEFLNGSVYQTKKNPYSLAIAQQI